MDRISPEKRSLNMSRIRSKNTKPEMIVRSFLFRKGFRFRVCVKQLPGTPDIVLPKYKKAIQIRGCFWHRHEGCQGATMPTSNQSFWENKFYENMARDSQKDQALISTGWDLLVLWECEIYDGSYLQQIRKFLPISTDT